MKCSLMKCVLMHLKAEKNKLPTTTINLDEFSIITLLIVDAANQLSNNLSNTIRFPFLFQRISPLCHMRRKNKSIGKVYVSQANLQSGNNALFWLFHAKGYATDVHSIDLCCSEMAKFPKLLSLPVGIGLDIMRVGRILCHVKHCSSTGLRSIECVFGAHKYPYTHTQSLNFLSCNYLRESI